MLERLRYRLRTLLFPARHARAAVDPLVAIRTE